MTYSTQPGFPSTWSAVLESFAQLVHLATIGAAAKVLKDSDARALLKPPYAVHYYFEPDISQDSHDRFTKMWELADTEYRNLDDCFKRLRDIVKYNYTDVSNLRYDDGEIYNWKHDCEELGRLQQRITKHLAQCAILHAQAVSAATTIMKNIGTAHVCPEQDLWVDNFPVKVASQEAEEEKPAAEEDGKKAEEVARAAEAKGRREGAGPAAKG